MNSSEAPLSEQKTPKDDNFRLVVEAIAQQVWTADAEGRLNFVNQRVIEYFGVESDAMLGKGWMAVIHPEDLPSAIEHWNQALSSGDPYEIPFRLRRADREYRWHLCMARPLRDANGKITQWFGSNTDISLQKETEVALRKSEAQHEAAQVQANFGSWELNLLTHTGSASLHWYHITGLDPKRGPPTFEEFLACVHPEDREAFAANHYAAMAERRGLTSEFRIVWPDGSVHWMEARSKMICDAEGKPIRIEGTNQDITARKQVEAELKASEARLADAQARAKTGSWRRDLITKEAVWSIEMYRLFDRNPSLGPPSFADFLFYVHPEDRDKFIKHHDESIVKKSGYHLDFRHIQKDGSTCWLEARSEIITNANGHPILLTGTAQDITERKQAEEALRESTERFQLVTLATHDAIWDWNLNTNHIWCNESFHTLFGYENQPFDRGRESWAQWIHPEDLLRVQKSLEKTLSGRNNSWVAEYRFRCQFGAYAAVLDRAYIIRNTEGKALRMVGAMHDITARTQAQEALEAANRELGRTNATLEHIAHYDPLTGLPNRVLLADRLQQAMAQNQRRGQILAVAYLDLDGFKEVNDTYGHDAGDKLLVTVSQRMRAALRDSDTLARIGGDEFVAVLTDLEHSFDYEHLLTRLLKASAEAVMVDQQSLQVSASIGVTLYPEDNVDAEQLLRHADQAMYLAKQTGKNCYHLFDIAHDSAVKSQRESLEHIRQALKNNEFVLYYQPKVNLRSGTVIGAEALIRWQHPTRGLLPPAQFLPIIAEHIISIELGEWVINTALKQMEKWLRQGLVLPVSVNIGAQQLQEGRFAQRLKQLLQAHPDCPAHYLELEILETSALQDITQVSNIMNECQALGVSFALDDFGTGYSSLSYLKRLPAELLKIDQSFIRDMLEDPDDLAIITGIVGLAAAFKRKVIAEGVETSAHGQKLLAIGCELAQGYGIAKPMPAADVPDWVATWLPGPEWHTPA